VLFTFSLINEFNLKSIHSCYGKEQCTNNRVKESSTNIKASAHNNYTNVSRYL